MTAPSIVSREAWLEARRDLLAAEKDLSRRGDQVADLRRRLPWVRVEKDYLFDAPGGTMTLADLFGGRRQLLVQHFMLAPGAQEGCRGCSFMADHADGMLVHLANRDITFAAISRAPLEEIERFRRRMGWRFPWVSSRANSFNYDFGASFTREDIDSGNIDYNYARASRAGEDMPGISVFFKDESGDVYHTYSAYGRGVEVMMGTYRMLDLTPKGRDEEGLPFTMQWLRHHDRYDPDPSASAGSCCAGRP